MARLVFADAIDYSKVAIHDHGYFPFGLQHRRTADSGRTWKFVAARCAPSPIPLRTSAVDPLSPVAGRAFYGR
jgi:hypothetical protein